MDEDENLVRERLARLHGNSDATTAQGNNSSNNDTALQERLDALSRGSCRAEVAAEDFNNRLASLLLPTEGGNASPTTTAEDISTRLARLSTGNSCAGVAATPVKQPPNQAYGVPGVSRPEVLNLVYKATCNVMSICSALPLCMLFTYDNRCLSIMTSESIK